MSTSGRRAPNRASDRLTKALFVVVSVLTVLTWSRASQAYPWMIRHGFDKCASCHTDPMGGETLTGMGRVISDTTLSTRYDGSRDPTSNALLFYGVEEPSWLRLGGSLRFMDIDYTFPQGSAKGKYDYFPMQMDVYGQATLFKRLRIAGSLGVGDATGGRIESRAAQITENNQSGDLNLISRTHWIGYDVTDEILVRAGRLNLPFGMRIPEHTMFVRNLTRTDRESDQQHGVAIDYSGGRWRGEIMGILGNYQISPDKYRERGYSAYLEYLLAERASIGVSSLITHDQDDRFLQSNLPYTRQAHGLTARLVPATPVVVLAEADVLLSNLTRPGYVGWVQTDYEFVQGLHAMLTLEAADAGSPTTAGSSDSPGNGKPKFDQWLTFAWFFFTHFDMRTDFILTEPKSAAAPMVLSQLHFYF